MCSPMNIVKCFFTKSLNYLNAIDPRETSILSGWNVRARPAELSNMHLWQVLTCLVWQVHRVDEHSSASGSHLTHIGEMADRVHALEKQVSPLSYALISVSYIMTGCMQVLEKHANLGQTHACAG